MCEMSLEETGLTRKRGAEVLGIIISSNHFQLAGFQFQYKINLFLEHEFEKEWNAHGGSPYTRHADRKKNGKIK